MPISDKGPFGKTLNVLSGGSSVSVYGYVFTYSGSHSFFDLAAYSRWKLNLKTFLHGYGLAAFMRHGYGVGHLDELLLLFNIAGLQNMTLPDPMGKGPLTATKDVRMAEILLDVWTNFAKFGKPAEKWKKCDSPHCKYGDSRFNGYLFSGR